MSTFGSNRSRIAKRSSVVIFFLSILSCLMNRPINFISRFIAEDFLAFKNPSLWELFSSLWTFLAKALVNGELCSVLSMVIRPLVKKGSRRMCFSSFRKKFLIYEVGLSVRVFFFVPERLLMVQLEFGVEACPTVSKLSRIKDILEQ